MPKPKQTGPDRCPRCNRKGKPISTGYFWCVFCAMAYDDEPDEGGDYSTDPTRRIQRQEGQPVRRRRR